MKLDLKISLSPTQSEFNEIKKWLIEEYEATGKGFYCNWSIIEEAYFEDKVISLNDDNSPIGFIVWRGGEIDAVIDIMEISPKYRNKGIGTYFFNQTASFFKEKGFLAINLYCAPEESENFWKKMDFIKFPDIRFNDSKLKYFKPLIEVQKTALNESKNKIELWDKQPYQVKDDVKPKWVWEINSDTNKPSLPIILPCDYDWNVKWTKEGEVIKESKVKYFSRNNPIRYGEFLYITELFEQEK